MKKIKHIAILLLVCFATLANAQKFGIRAGLNYSKFDGPVENQNEAFKFSTGFNFGINYAYEVTDLFSVLFEFGYTQVGTKYTYKGDSYFIIRETDNTIYEKGQRDMKLSISNGYLTFPIVANFKVAPKLEVYTGAYANIRVSPKGVGSFLFTSDSRPEDIVFIQSLDYDYASDKAREAKYSTRKIGVYDEGREVYFDKVGGAYYQFAEKKGNFINVMDFGLIGGFNYFLTKGFYVGLRAEYGLADITNNQMDASISTLDKDNQFILREDNDRHLGANLSIGFRF